MGTGSSLLNLYTDTSPLGQYERKLIPTETERANAASHRSSLEAVFSNFTDVIRFFQTGSFKFGTGLKGISDVDYFVGLDKDSPFQKLLTNTYEALKNRYPNTQIKINSPSVVVDFATKPKYEIIPAVFLYKIKTNLGNHDVFKIASGNSYKLTCPEYYNDLIDRENKRLDGKLKSLIRLLKAWSYYNNISIGSFYLEMYATIYCQDRSSINLGLDLERILQQFSVYGCQPIPDPLGIENFYPKLSAAHILYGIQSSIKPYYDAAYTANRATGKMPTTYWNIVFKGNFSL